MIFACILWLAVGLVAGSVGMLALFAYVTERVPHVRREYFRELVKRYPLDYEMALQHHDAVHPSQATPYAFDPIEFATCTHCNFPWPLAGGVLEGHAQIDDAGKVVNGVCPGSGTKDYENGEA